MRKQNIAYLLSIRRYNVYHIQHMQRMLSNAIINISNVQKGRIKHATD